MDRMAELRRLGVVEAYLTDLICDVKDPRHADILMQALNSVQQALLQIEEKFVPTAAKASVASL